jgi:hypothetical protein
MKYLTNTSNPFTNKPYCNYTFDLNEPETTGVNDEGWYVSWFFRLKSPFESVNFEITWSFIKSKFNL